jgi:hypothetical protein
MDGAARRAPVGKDGVVRLPVAGNGGGAEHVVELWYGSSSPRPGKIVTVPPYILGADQADRFYWQLATPQDEHLLLGPSGLTPELQWQWRGLYCGRQSNLQQRDLETWVGATEQTPPPEAANQYLFTSFEPPKELVVFTASRRLILLAASGAALLAGLLMVYCPVLRHPGVLLAGGLGLLAASILVPELSLLAAQAASMGLVLALLGRVLDWIVVRRRLQRATIRGRSYPGADAKPQAAPIPRSDVGLHATTVKAPLPVASPAPESKS